MATSERWAELYEARDRRKYLRSAVEQADLYVTVWNRHAPGQTGSTAADNYLGWEMLNRGSRVVPFAIGFVGLDTKGIKNTDPRGDPLWAEMADRYPGPALEQLAVTYPSAVIFAGGVPIAVNPEVPLPEPIVAWLDGEYYKDYGGYKTNEDVEQETRFNNFYMRAYENALSWWFLVHGLHPGTFIDYEKDLYVAIQQLNIAEAGDVTQQLIMQDIYPSAPVVVSPSESEYSSPLTHPGAPVPSQPAGLMEQYGEYLPYAAAGAVVLFALSRRRKATT